MKFPKHNKAGPVILAYIDANPDATIKDIQRATGISKSTIERNIRAMKKANAIYVSNYHPHASGSGKVPQGFSIGSMPSVPRPKLNPQQAHIRRLEKQLEKRRMERMAKVSREIGTFGILVAQMVVKSKPRQRTSN